MNSKKNSWKHIATAGGLMLILIVFFAVAGTLFNREKSAPVSVRTNNYSPVIILDPGHGGEDGGAVGINGIAEKELNLSISLKLRDLLELQGYTVYMTRDCDHMVCDDSITGISRRKKADMYRRLELMNEYPDAVVLSIHQNRFEQAQYKGAQMFYGRCNSRSAVLAQALQETFAELLQPDNQREIKRGERNLFLLWEAENPIVLVECGFLSNSEECALLCTEEYQQKTAFTILAGLMKGLKQSEKVFLPA